MPEQIGPYRVEREVGRGGMGVVYRAIDERLDRVVAIKALPEELAADAGRLERFEREAKVLAQLNHPNVAGIHGIEEQDGAKYLVLEFVEGDTLADRLDHGPLPVDEAIDLAIQIAAGVEAAHEAGVIHRDLKPANIMVTPEGVAKVLDFGLAKVDEPTGGSSATFAESPTLTTPQPQHSPTIAGAILGTAAYMSPEQARGRRVTKQTDIWSFGVVLYEMLVGESPFIGETATDSIGAILHKDVDFGHLPPGTPLIVRHVLARCLERDKNRRLHDIADARIELERVGAEDSDAPIAPQPATPLKVLGFAAIVALVAATGTWLATRGGATLEVAARPMQFEISLQFAEQIGSLPLAPYDVVITTDGSAVVIEVAGNEQPLFLREMNSLEMSVLVGTEGAEYPFFSPDGRWIGYYNDGRILRIPREGGMPIPICTTPSPLSSAAWLDDGTILATFRETLSVILSVPASGGELAEFCSNESRPDLLGFDEICRVPDQRYVFAGAYTGNAIDAYELVAISLDNSSIETILPNASDPAVTADGHLVYLRGSSLYAVRFNPDERTVVGAEALVLENVAAGQWGDVGFFALSLNGTLAYIPGKRFGVDRQLAWVDRTGEVETLPVEPDVFVPDMDLSTDGTHVAVNTLRQSLELWAYDLTRGTRRSLNTEGECSNPVWDPAGRRLAYARITAAAGYDITEIIIHDLANGSTQTLPLEPHGQFPYSWLSDGAGILFRRNKRLPPPLIDADILLYRFDEEEPLKTILATDHSEASPVLSHDGGWLAYRSDENGRDQVFLRAYPGDGRAWQVSFSGITGGWIAWASDDSELYWVADDHLFAVTIETEPDLEIGTPEALFASPWPLAGDRWAAIDVAPDGRFLMIQPAEWENQARDVRVVLNWTTELQRLVGRAE